MASEGAIDEDATMQSPRRRLLEDFHIGPVLGTGGFSTVCVGVRKEDNLPVAIKTLHKHAGDPTLQG